MFTPKTKQPSEMMTTPELIAQTNQSLLADHQHQLYHLQEILAKKQIDIEPVIQKLQAFQVSVPSWALGTGGTRFGRFPIGGEPRSIEEKIADTSLLHQLTGSNNAISLHIPWDTSLDYSAVRQFAHSRGIKFDAINSNTFQDHPQQVYSYKYGSLSHTKAEVRRQAIEHNCEVINIGQQLGSKALTTWLGDGANFPGQNNFRKAYERTAESLQEIYRYLPTHWQMLIEYKPYEPNFYSMVIPDWGTALLLAQQLGDQAQVLVDLGHHLPNTNIEQIIARLAGIGRLGGFHFNGSSYGDDDLTTGALKPYRLFLIFQELVNAMWSDAPTNASDIAWMIDASHNTKDPIEDLMQATEGILIEYAHALLIDQKMLEYMQEENEVVQAQEILQAAFRVDVRPLVAEARFRNKACIDPLTFFRAQRIRAALIEKRGVASRATGL
ncbi:sugar isomerase [Microscilla marina ATCC 23134]|uniref:Sugar isomerase n=2 Tax=Microscilla marina TaxID=1027 RepID=A1ZCL5_MICM2|nr:sugar isomerase [Microscilla marina ATCC 23134]